LTARREAAAVKENIVAAVVGLDEPEAFLAYDFSYRPGHIPRPPVILDNP